MQESKPIGLCQYRDRTDTSAETFTYQSAFSSRTTPASATQCQSAHESRASNCQALIAELAVALTKGVGYDVDGLRLCCAGNHRAVWPLRIC